MYRSKYLDLVDKNQWKHWKNSAECLEIDEEFLFFDDLYKPASEIIPEDYIVIDLGGYVGVQAVLFREHKIYVDVDNYNQMFIHSGNLPPARYKQDNSIHIQLSIQNYLKDYISGEKKFPDKAVVLCSAVPCYKQVITDLQKINGLEWCVWYPCEDAVGNGILGEQIAKEADIRHKQNQIQFKFEKA